MPPGPDLAQHVRTSGGKQSRGRAVVHGDDHRGRSARGADALDYFGGSAQPLATAPAVLRDREREQPGLGQHFNLPSRERPGAVDLLGCGRDDVLHDAGQCRLVTGRG